MTNTISIESTRRIFNTNYTLSKGSHIHRAYVVSVPSQSHTTVHLVFKLSYSYQLSKEILWIFVLTFNDGGLCEGGGGLSFFAVADEGLLAFSVFLPEMKVIQDYLGRISKNTIVITVNCALS